MLSKRPQATIRRATLKDIAAAVGVSQMTVSLALRGDAQIPPKTQARVREAAAKLNYVPHEGARRLKSGKSGKIAFVAARLSHAFLGQVLAGIEQRSHETGLYPNSILPFSTWYDTAQREAALRQILYGGLADAVMLASMPPSAEMASAYKKHGVPLVLIEDRAPLCHSVRVDNVLGARLATQHLLKAGCKHIALVVGELPPKGIELNPTTVERRKGFADAMKAAGHKEDPALITPVRYFAFEEGEASLDGLLKAQPKLDGIFCAAGDRVAMGIMKRARELKLKFPQDLKLIGYDDLQSSALLSPALSTVHQPIELLGSEAFDLVIKALEHPELKEVDVMHRPELILRSTT